jgi:tetratricopeptide (TPR) repeat protein
MCSHILCTILLMDGQPEAALDVANRGLELSSENVCLVWAKARCLLEQDDASAALDMLKPFEGLDGATFFDPKIAYARSLFDEDIPSLLGSASFHVGKYNEAARYFEKALKSAPASVEYRAKLALCHNRQSQVVKNP